MEFFNSLNEEQKAKVEEKVNEILNDRNNNTSHVALNELKEKVAKSMYILLKDWYNNGNKRSSLWQE